MRTDLQTTKRLAWLLALGLLLLPGCDGTVGDEMTCVPYTSRCGEVEDTLEVCTPSGSGWSLAMLCTGGCEDGLCAGMIGPELADKDPLWGRPPDDGFYLGDPLPPQAPGIDLPGVKVALPGPEYVAIGDPGLGFRLGIQVEKGGVLQIDPGEWLEPKDGRCQRLIYHGKPLDLKDVGKYRVSGFFCMQHENWGPSDLGYFSEPKPPEGKVQECQKECGPSQSCIWSCQLKQ